MIILREGRRVMVCNACGITEDGDAVDKALLDSQSQSEIDIGGGMTIGVVGRLLCPKCKLTDPDGGIFRVEADDPAVKMK